MSWMGRNINGIFQFLYTLSVYKKRKVCLLKYLLQNCQEHSYGFENLRSSWGVGILFYKLPYLCVFLKNN